MDHLTPLKAKNKSPIKGINNHLNSDKGINNHLNSGPYAYWVCEKKLEREIYSVQKIHRERERDRETERQRYMHREREKVDWATFSSFNPLLQSWNCCRFWIKTSTHDVLPRFLQVSMCREIDFSRDFVVLGVSISVLLGLI